MNYYLRVGSENQGPFTIDDLRSRGVSASDYVWRDGLAEWQPAGALPELAGVMLKPAAMGKSFHGGDEKSPYAPPQTMNFPDYGPQITGPLKQSGYGIASTILGVGTMVGVFGGLMIVGMMQQNGMNAREPTPLLMLLSAAICFGGPLLQLVALVLGIVGIFQHDRSKIFGIIGTVLNGLVMVGFAAFIIVAILIASSAAR